MLFGDTGSDDLVLDLAVLEEQKQGNRADIVFHGELTRVIDVYLGDFRLAFDFGRQLIEDGADHLAGAAPFRPEVHEHGDAGVENFGLEIGFSDCQSHGSKMEHQSRNVKSRPAKNAGRLLNGDWDGLDSDSARECDSDVGEVENAAGQQDIDDGKDHGFCGLEIGLGKARSGLLLCGLDDA